jgi:hypothetical protein
MPVGSFGQGVGVGAGVGEALVGPIPGGRAWARACMASGAPAARMAVARAAMRVARRRAGMNLWAVLVDLQVAWLRVAG